ncbi:hypothetical protein Tco_1172337 [Tanacetum coccineum]
MPTEMELTLEQTQQGGSYVVSNIQVISFTMKMEILLESTSNKLMVDPHGFEGISKDGHGGTWFQLTHRSIAACSYSADIYKDTMKAQVHVSRLPLL